MRFGTRTWEVPHAANPTPMLIRAMQPPIHRVPHLTTQHPELSTGELAFQYWPKDPLLLLTPLGDERGIPDD